MDNWGKVEELFHHALEHSPEDRQSFLEHACQGNKELLNEVRKLLECSLDKDFMETPLLNRESENSRSESEEDLIGKCIGSHRLLSFIARGGMGLVYKARDERTNQLEALKILPPEFSSDPSRVRRFQREAKATAALSHPGIASVYEVGEADGVPFLAMEFVAGKDLAGRLAEGPMEHMEINRIVLQVAGALSAAHEIGIVHRDIKPSNIMITPAGKVKVLDFGLVKISKEGESAGILDMSTDSLTRPGTVLGTVSYLSPEQVLGKEADHRADIFALGIVLYQMATGRLPFQGASPTETLDRICHVQPLPLARFNWKASERFEALVRKCLQKDPSDRYGSMHELIADLGGQKELEATSPEQFFNSRMLVVIAALILLFIVLFASVRFLRGASYTQEATGAHFDTLSTTLAAVEGESIVSTRLDF